MLDRHHEKDCCEFHYLLIRGCTPVSVFQLKNDCEKYSVHLSVRHDMTANVLVNCVPANRFIKSLNQGIDKTSNIRSD